MTRLRSEALYQLWKAGTFVKPEPCYGLTKRDLLREWWNDFRPRFPRYSVTAYGKGEALFSAHNLSRRAKNVLVRELPQAESWGEITVQVEKY